jgi:archaellum component FlaC
VEFTGADALGRDPSKYKAKLEEIKKAETKKIFDMLKEQLKELEEGLKATNTEYNKLSQEFKKSNNVPHEQDIAAIKAHIKNLKKRMKDGNIKKEIDDLFDTILGGGKRRTRRRKKKKKRRTKRAWSERGLTKREINKRKDFFKDPLKYKSDRRKKIFEMLNYQLEELEKELKATNAEYNKLSQEFKKPNKKKHEEDIAAIEDRIKEVKAEMKERHKAAKKRLQNFTIRAPNTEDVTGQKVSSPPGYDDFVNRLSPPTVGGKKSRKKKHKRRRKTVKKRRRKRRR